MIFLKWYLRVNTLFILFIVFTSTLLLGQTNYQFDHISSDDGLLDDIAYSIYQDSKGYIWIGTMAGLQRYDGHQFLNFEYNPRNKTSGLKENVIRHITESSDGTIWAGTQGGGIVRFKNGNLLPALTTENGLSGNIVDVIEEDPQGNLWIGTENGLDVFKNGEFVHHFKNEPGNTNSLSHNKIYGIAFDKTGSTWIGTQNGLNEYTNNGTFIQYYSDPGNTNSLNGNYIHDVMADREGNIWAAAISAGINKINPVTKEFTRYDYQLNEEGELGHPVVLNLAEDNEGGIWVATWGGGLYRLFQNKFSAYLNDPLDDKTIASNNVEEIMIDSNGNLWTANYLGGVNRLSKRKVFAFQPLDRNEKPFTSTIRDIYSASDGTVWIASYSGVIAFKDGNYQYFFGNNPRDLNQLSSNRIASISEGPDGEIWVGNYGYGVDIIRNGQVKKFKQDEFSTELFGSQIHHIVSDKNGNTWLGTIKQGLTKYGDGEFTNFRKTTSTSGLTSNTIYSIFPDKNGTLWLATGDGGLCEYTNGNFTCFQYEDGNNLSAPKNNLRAVAVDKDGFIWVGYYGGLSKMDPITKEFTGYQQEQGLAGLIIEDITVDRNGEIWIATHSGASHYLPDSDRFETFTKKDGMTDNRLIAVTASKDSDKVYFCSASSFFEFDTNSQQFRQISAPVFSDFRLTNPPNDSITSYCRSQIAIGEKITLSYNYNSFDINFASLSGDIDPDITYSYRVLPIEKEWTSLLNATNVDFKYLKPGAYTFEVSATDYNGNLRTSSLQFEILTPYWQSAWFIGLVIALILLILGVIVGLRIRTIKQQRTNLKEVVNQKTSDLIGVLEVIKAKSLDLSASSKTLKNKSGTLANSAENQRKNVTHIQNAVEDITDNTRKNNENASITHDISTETVSQFDEIKSAAQRNIEEMKVIESKLKLLDDIFKQTNILAINASIEAARAGQHGSGFAVISAEVRKLAETSREASQEIVKSVKLGSEETRKVGDLIQEFTPKIEKAAELIKEISEISNQQNKSVENINVSLAEFFKGTNQNSGFSQEIFEISNDLENLVKELNKNVNLV